MAHPADFCGHAVGRIRAARHVGRLHVNSLFRSCVRVRTLVRAPALELFNPASVMGAILGWAFLAPIWALLNMAANALASVEDPEVFMPETWLWALVPLAAVLIVAGLRQRAIGRNPR
jgi:hypothetical protein